jgi:hypothetical protein
MNRGRSGIIAKRVGDGWFDVSALPGLCTDSLTVCQLG